MFICVLMQQFVHILFSHLSVDPTSGAEIELPSVTKVKHQFYCLGNNLLAENVVYRGRI